MRKAATLLLFFVCSARLVSAQINWGAYSQSAPTGLMDNPSSVGLIIAIGRDNNSFWVADERSKYFDELLKDSAFLRMHGKNIIARTTFDTARVHFFLHGVDKRVAAGYQYRVIEYPGRVVEPWIPVSRFSDSSVIKESGLPQMAYLGGYKAQLSNMLIVDVRKIGGKQIIATAMVAWESIKPVVTNIYTSDNFDAFMQRLQYPWSNQAARQELIPEDIKLSSANTNLIFFLKADIYHRKQLQYKLIRNGDVVIPWKDNDYDNSFVWLKPNQPGKYQLNIRYAAQPQHITAKNFEISPAWYQSNWFRIAAGVFIAACAGLLVFLLLLIRQKRRTQLEVANKTKLQLELKAIHAQLNPHFVFNALSSIQGLINQQDLKGANIYLADFAKLMRESLKGGNKDEIPLIKEIDVLETYLNLEHLRFGFHSQITIQPGINCYETNIPSLLLQPLVENAVKHGIATMRESGKIEIHFSRTEDSMEVNLSDNGAGFNTDYPPAGYGLKLTRDRIKLLNELKPEQQIDFEIQSSPSGTRITLTFNNWFL